LDPVRHKDKGKELERRAQRERQQLQLFINSLPGCQLEYWLTDDRAELSLYLFLLRLDWSQALKIAKEKENRSIVVETLTKRRRRREGGREMECKSAGL
jgi:hypothetical protein